MSALATAVGVGGTIAPPIEVIGRIDALVPSFAQQRLWFLAQMDGVSEAYHIPLGLRLRGSVHKDALIRSLDRLVERHESLRTTFYTIDGELYQRLGQADEGFALIQEDLRDLDGIDDRLSAAVRPKPRVSLILSMAR